MKQILHTLLWLTTFIVLTHGEASARGVYRDDAAPQASVVSHALRQDGLHEVSAAEPRHEAVLDNGRPLPRLTPSRPTRANTAGSTYLLPRLTQHALRHVMHATYRQRLHARMTAPIHLVTVARHCVGELRHILR